MVGVRAIPKGRSLSYGLKFGLDLGINSFNGCLLQLTDEHEQRKLTINRLRLVLELWLELDVFLRIESELGIA